MTRIIESTTIYDGTAKVLNVNGAEQCKIQGIGSGAYTLKGRLSSDMPFDAICAIKASDFAKKAEITDESVWTVDISGYSQITVEASGYNKIYVTLVG